MKLLLTSDGLVNKSIRDTFVELLPVRPEEATVVFIPTAKNYSGKDKRYFMRVIESLDAIGVGTIDFVDIDAMPKEQWLPRLEASHAIYVGGGNTYYLLSSVRKSGLDVELPGLLHDRLYIGDSAGAILVTPSIDIAEVDDGDENAVGLKDTTGLNIVDFEVSPHTPEDVSLAGNKRYAKNIANPLYAFDNQSALKYSDGKIEIVGKANYWLFNEPNPATAG